jgi:hypothetical protein
MLHERSRPHLRADLQYRELDDGAVLYDTASERIHTLNVTAAYIWNCCDGAHDISEIASQLQQQANVPIETALKHVHEAINYFQDEGLLRSHRESAFQHNPVLSVRNRCSFRLQIPNPTRMGRDPERCR